MDGGVGAINTMSVSRFEAGARMGSTRKARSPLRCSAGRGEHAPRPQMAPVSQDRTARKEMPRMIHRK